MKLSAHIGVTYRTRIDGLSEVWNMTLAQAVRRLVVLGLGGDDNDVFVLEEESSGRRAQMQERIAADHPDTVLGSPSPRALASSGLRPRAIVSVRFPPGWPRRICHAGGLRACIEAGLRAVGEGD